MSAIRAAIATALTELGGAVVLDTQIICNSLVSNVHRHTRGDGRLRITRPGNNGTICIEVDDSSSHLPTMPSRGPADRRQGYGLQMVSRLAKQWGVWRGAQGKTVWVELGYHS